MRTVTKQMKMLIDRGIDGHDTPGFPDWQSICTFTSGNKSVHASTKVRVLELHILEQLGNSVLASKNRIVAMRAVL